MLWLFCRDDCIEGVIRSLKGQLVEDVLTIEVRRDFIWPDAMREARKKKFNPNKQIKVAINRSLFWGN